MGLKVDFVADCFAFRHERPYFGFLGTRVRVDFWENLCISKFAVFLSRGAEKDVRNIGAILSRVMEELNEPDRFVSFVEWLVEETQKREYLANEISYICEACGSAAEYLRRSGRARDGAAAAQLADIVREMDEDIRNAVDADGPEL